MLRRLNEVAVCWGNCHLADWLLASACFRELVRKYDHDARHKKRISSAGG